MVGFQVEIQPLWRYRSGTVTFLSRATLKISEIANKKQIFIDKGGLL